MSRMPHRIFCASGWALAMAATACAGGAPGRLSPATDDAAVYRAVLAPEPRARVLRRVVQRTTEPTPAFPGQTLAEQLATLPIAMPSLDTSTVRSFLALNSQVAAIPDLRDPTLSWMSAEEWRALTDSYGRWNEFMARYPDSGGVTMLSRIGYSRDGTQALVYLMRACPPCGGQGESVLLSRVDGVWTVVARAVNFET